MSQESESRRVFSASEIGNYVVCPEAWRLKYVVRGSFKQVDETNEVFQLRKDWLKSADLSAQLKRYARIVFILLVILVFAVFIIDRARWLRSRAMQDAEQSSPAPSSPEVPATENP